MEKKLTKKQKYMGVLEILQSYGTNEQIEFITNEIALLEKKYKASSSKVNEENIKLADIVLEEMTKIGKAVTITDLLETETIKNYVLENGKHISNQKLTSIASSLVDSKKLVRVVEKKKAYFSLMD